MAREVVGQAYILMRADGKLLERDIRAATRKSMAKMGEDDADVYRQSFSQELINFEKSNLVRFRQAVARSLADDDYSGFRKEFGSVGDTVEGVTRIFEDLRRQNKITQDQFDKSGPSIRRWVARLKKDMEEEATRVERDYHETSLRQTAQYLRRMQILYADADRTGNWDALRRRNESISESVARLNRELGELGAGMRMGDDDVRRISDSISSWGQRMEQAHRDAGNALDQYREKFRTTEIDNFTRALARAQETGDWSRMIESGERAEDGIRRLSERMDRMRDEGSLLDRQVDDLRRSMDRWYDSTGRQNDRLAVTRDIVQAIRRNNFEPLVRSGESARDAVRRLTDQLEEWNREGRINDDMLDMARRRLGEWGSESDRADGRLGNMILGFRNGRSAVGVFSETLGRAFGRGSRNDLLNFVGSVIRNMTLFAGALPLRALEMFTDRLDIFSSTRSAQLAAGAGTFTSALRGMGAALGGPQGVVTLLAGVAAGAFVLGEMLPVVASMISMLAGSVVLLVGSLVTGLIGALLALGPVVLGAVGGVGLLIGAFAKLGDSSIAKGAFEGLKADLNEVTDRLVPKLESVIASVAPRLGGLLDNMGQAVGRVLDDLNRRLNSPEMDKFFQAWGESLPKITESVGLALNALGQALTAFFVPILPYAERLAENFRLLMERFSTWAQSAQGQNSIAKYMHTAWENAKQLWDMLSNLTGILGSLFTIGAEAAVGMNNKLGEQRVMFGQIKSDWDVYGTTGEGVMQRINGKLEEFEKWLNTDEGREKVRQWFEDAEEFMGTAYTLLSQLGEAFDKLDSEGGRESLNSFITLLSTLAEWLNIVVALSPALNGTLGAIGSFFGAIYRHGDEAGVRLRDQPWIKAINEWEDQIDWGRIGETFREGIKGVFYVFKPGEGGLVDDMIQNGQDLIQGLIDGALEKIRNFGNEVWNPFLEDVREWLGIASPSTVFHTYGLDVVAGFINGLLELPGQAAAIFGEFVAETAGQIGGWVSETAGQIGGWVSQTAGQFGGWVSQTAGQFAGWVSTTAGNIGTWASQTAGRFATWVGTTAGNIGTWASSTAGRFATWVGTTAGSIGGWARSTAGTVTTWVSDRIKNIAGFDSSTNQTIRGWASSMKSKFDTWKTNLGTTFSTAWTNARTTTNQASSRLQTAAEGIVSAIGRGLNSLKSTVTQKFSAAFEAARSIANSIGGLLSNARSAVSNWSPPWNASGKIYYGPSIIGVGEAGPEAIVPLNRPLHMVDPSVRALSAIAQGLAAPPTASGAVDRGRHITIADGAIRVEVPTTDPYRAAEATLDRIALELT